MADAVKSVLMDTQVIENNLQEKNIFEDNTKPTEQSGPSNLSEQEVVT